MIKAHIYKEPGAGNHAEVQANGDVFTLAAEAAALISVIYKKFEQEKPDLHQLFKARIQKLVSDESVVWRAEMKEVENETR